MAITLVNLTGDVADVVGADYDPEQVRVWIETNVNGPLVDTANNVVRLGPALATVATNGKFQFTGLVATNSSDVNPTGFQYQLWVEYFLASTGKGKRQSFGWFSLTATSDLSEVIEAQFVPPTWLSALLTELQGYVDDAEAAAAAAEAAAGDGVLTVVPGSNIDVDSTDPAHPVVSVEALTAADVTDFSAAADARITAAKDTDGTLAANSDAKIPSQKAVKTYADQLIAAADALVFKGVIDCSANPNYPAANKGDTYRVSVAGKIGGGAGVNVEVGDLLLCLADGTLSGNQATVGASWSIAQTNIDGAVIGPAGGVTNGHFVQWDTTSGRLVKGGLALDLDGTLAANSDTRVASQKAVKTAIAAAVAATPLAGIPFIYMGSGGGGSSPAVGELYNIPSQPSVRFNGVDALGNDWSAPYDAGLGATFLQLVDRAGHICVGVGSNPISIGAGVYDFQLDQAVSLAAFTAGQLIYIRF